MEWLLQGQGKGIWLPWEQDQETHELSDLYMGVRHVRERFKRDWLGKPHEMYKCTMMPWGSRKNTFPPLAMNLM